MNDEARARIAANDRLLKAVITLLAIKDPDLLDELDVYLRLQANRAARSAKPTREHANIFAKNWT